MVNWLSFEVEVVRVYKRALRILEELLAHDDFISSEAIAARWSAPLSSPWGSETHA